MLSRGAHSVVGLNCNFVARLEIKSLLCCMLRLGGPLPGSRSGWSWTQLKRGQRGLGLGEMISYDLHAIQDQSDACRYHERILLIRDGQC